jgi:hypothetical protein
MLTPSARGDELSVIDIALGRIAELCTVLDLTASTLAVEIMLETYLANHLVALCALPERGTKITIFFISVKVGSIN